MIPACMGLASYGREPAVWPFAESHMGNSLPQSQRGLRTQPRVSTLGPSTQRRALKGRQIERAARCEIHLVASRQAPNWSLDVPIRGPKWPKEHSPGFTLGLGFGHLEEVGRRICPIARSLRAVCSAVNRYPGLAGHDSRSEWSVELAFRLEAPPKNIVGPRSPLTHRY
jgi:hypothetical protein